MSYDPMAPWPPNAPPVAEHFERAAAPPTPAQDEQTQSGGAAQAQEGAGGQPVNVEQATLQEESALMKNPEDPGMHLRPDNKQLVEDVHADVERQQFLDKHARHGQDLEPKL